jgi:hypothetical protein
MSDSVECTVGDTGDNRAPVAMADKDRIVKVLVVQCRDHVADVGVQIDREFRHDM